LLDETSMLGIRPANVPMDPINHKLLKDNRELFEDLGRYFRLVGKRNYLTITRPYISYAVSVVSLYIRPIQTRDMVKINTRKI
jgi:hypothetical protein